MWYQNQILLLLILYKVLHLKLASELLKILLYYTMAVCGPLDPPFTCRPMHTMAVDGPLNHPFTCTHTCGDDGIIKMRLLSLNV